MYRLIYKSRCDGEITWDLVRSILHGSEKSNAEHDISGVLLATAQHFLQVMEGRFEDVNQTFMRIVRDPRHQDIQLVSFNCVDARLFEALEESALNAYQLARRAFENRPLGH